MEKIDCPFCGKKIRISVGDKCGSEPNGCVMINHTCDSGLFIEWFESGQDKTDAIKAISCRSK